MSTHANSGPRSGGNRDDRTLIVVLLSLLALSVVWPAPVLWLNDLGPGLRLTIDHESFLGREAMEWDVVFWWIAGTVGITISCRDRSTPSMGLSLLRRATSTIPGRVAGTLRSIGFARFAAVAAIVFGVCAIMAVTIDDLVISWLVSVDQSSIWRITSLINRLGGGVVPGLTALFIAVVGVTRARESWIRLFVAIVGASVVSALVLHGAKLIGRLRPELFYTPLELQPGVGESFPSGHTLSIFVVAGGIALVARSLPARIALVILAISVAITRVLTFRHWPSDVTFSALLGLTTIFVFVRATIIEDETSGPPST